MKPFYQVNFLVLLNNCLDGLTLKHPLCAGRLEYITFIRKCVSFVANSTIPMYNFSVEYDFYMN